MERQKLSGMLEAAFAALSAVSVRGEDVERMADARAYLRQAWTAIREESERQE